MDLLPLAQMALNSRPSSAIGGKSPFFLRNGYNVEPLMEPTPADGSASRYSGSIDAQKYVQRSKDAQDFAQERRQPEQYRIGDKVWLNLQHIKTPQLMH